MTGAQDAFTIKGPRAAISAAALSRLGSNTFIETFGHLYAPADLEAFLAGNHSLTSYQRLIDDPDIAIWTAHDRDDRPVGYVVSGPSVLPIKDKPDSAGELMRLYIYQACQGAGLGSRLLGLALDWLEARFAHVYLSVYAENHGAQRLYARHGFEKVQAYEFMVGSHADPEYILKKST